ncbi:hypothetical protein N7456_002470 [Penicillium angulare]|uniref:Bacteriophage T5 Orf172 DNA-binding domain-containing protein n=1 Tax=Penicillium angulare TaxID=116970 RepID=A0A9W9G890_9EURO|nr:hypothetical protein N7456_002470 [Penicillium angulare]
MDEIEDREAKQRLFDLISSKWPAPTIVLDFETPNSTRKENCHKADLFWDKDEALTLVMKKNLSSEDKKTGYIYVIYFPGSPGKLKVGTSEIHCKDARFKNHQECFPGCDLIYCKSVGNARRVEQIIFTDFEDNRRLMKHPCSNLNCRQKHTEFFEVGKAELFARIDKWREWMDSMDERPYSKGGVFNIKASRSSPHRKSVRESIGGSSPPSTPSKTGKGPPSGSIPTSFFSELEDSGYGSEPEMSGGDSCGSLTSQMESVKIK